MAIFVEGYTELLFADKLVIEIAGQENVAIEKRQPRGGSKVRKTNRLVGTLPSNKNKKYYVLIVDCGNDATVKTKIIEDYDSLVKLGYEVIIGLRDVYPFPRNEIKILESRLKQSIKTIPINVVFILSTMEIEAWFLAEHSHFLKIDKKLTTKYIRSKLKFDPSDDMSLRNHPTDDMKKIYKLAKKEYIKPSEELTINNLDYNEIALNLPDRYSDIKLLVDKCFEFFN